MLSYRHAFHAGNFADVLKHSVLVHTLAYMTLKDKALRIIDTHAGAGGYALTGHQPLKNREYDNGIGALWQKNDLPPLLADYLEKIKANNPSEQLRFYPGSPALAQALMREQDRLFLHELHSTDCRLLKEAIGRDKRVTIIEEDGFQGLQALLPPPDRRALVLIDPSYEIKSDYQHVVRQVIEAHKRFATGTYLLWYPVVMRQRIDELERALIKSGIRNIQLFEFAMVPDTLEPGMTASGMIVINPPWTLWSAMELALPYLVKTLGTDDSFFRQAQLVDE
jgi:23S rRNA (adenine2030-N6)-methyltransferase